MHVEQITEVLITEVLITRVQETCFILGILQWLFRVQSYLNQDILPDIKYKHTIIFPIQVRQYIM